MTTLKTQLNPRSADFQANVEAMQTVVADLHEKVEKIALGGPEAARQKHLPTQLPRRREPGSPQPACAAPRIQLAAMPSNTAAPPRRGTCPK